MQTTHVRKSDLPAILDLQIKCYSREAELYKNWDIPPLQQTLASLEQDFENQTFLKVVDGSRIIASVRAWEINNTCHIGRLFVDSDYQNRGIGKHLILVSEDFYKHMERFELCAGHLSVNTLALYSKLGYSEFRREHILSQLQLVYMEKYAILQNVLPVSKVA